MSSTVKAQAQFIRSLLHQDRAVELRCKEVADTLERLEAALEHIADEAMPSAQGEDLWDRGRLEGHNEAADIARAALGRPPLPRCMTCRAHTPRTVRTCKECR